MANQDDALLREVDQELAQERQWTMFRKHGPAVIGGAVAIVLGVAAWQFWTYTKTQASREQSLAYSAALETLQTDAAAGRAALAKVAEENTGYAVLARLQLAASYAAGGERLKALEIYRELYKSDAPKRVRQLAQLRAAHLALPDGRDAVLADLGDLAVEQGRYGFYAREVEALAALYAKDYEAALSTFRALSIATDAPEGVRRRAEEFAALASAAKDGVNFTGETRVEDLLKAVGEEPAGEENAAPAGPSGEASDEPDAQEEPDAAEGEDGGDAGHDHAE